jgi:hypothetical protein
MKKELTDIEQLSSAFILILLLVILCFIWRPAISKSQDIIKKPASSIEVDRWNVLHVGTYIFN